ncbi:MAG TPA: hypothetical protein VF666_16890 [Pyrinomonadaceae bacterium]
MAETGAPRTDLYETGSFHIAGRANCLGKIDGAAGTDAVRRAILHGGRLLSELQVETACHRAKREAATFDASPSARRVGRRGSS